MRPSRLAAEIEAAYAFHSPQAAADGREPKIAPPEHCNASTCPWRPYTDSRDFESNATIIVVILFCALLCALALNAVVRCILRRRRRQPELVEQPKPVGCADAATEAEVPTVVYRAGVGLAGAVPECAICLTEFADGEGIRVLERCKHGFHVHCIKGWLSSHFTCPTCRASCLPLAPAQAPEGSASGQVPGQP